MINLRKLDDNIETFEQIVSNMSHFDEIYQRLQDLSKNNQDIQKVLESNITDFKQWREALKESSYALEKRLSSIDEFSQEIRLDHNNVIKTFISEIVNWKEAVINKGNDFKDLFIGKLEEYQILNHSALERVESLVNSLFDKNLRELSLLQESMHIQAKNIQKGRQLLFLSVVLISLLLIIGIFGVYLYFTLIK